MGSRSVSLYAGMTTVRSTEGESPTEPRGRRAAGLRAERYVFSEALGTMMFGDQMTKSVYACVIENAVSADAMTSWLEYVE